MQRATVGHLQTAYFLERTDIPRGDLRERRETLAFIAVVIGRPLFRSRLRLVSNSLRAWAAQCSKRCRRGRGQNAATPASNGSGIARRHRGDAASMPDTAPRTRW